MRVLHNPITDEEIKVTRTFADTPDGEIYKVEGVRFMMLPAIAEILGFNAWELTPLAGRTADTVELFFKY